MTPGRGSAYLAASSTKVAGVGQAGAWCGWVPDFTPGAGTDGVCEEGGGCIID